MQKVKIQNLQGQKNGRIMLFSKCAVRDSKNQNLSNSKKLVDYEVV